MKKILLGICFLLYVNSEFAQTFFSIEHITSDNGLPANGIKGLQYDDKTGFLWIGTELGLVRYNGSSFYTFLSKGEKLNNGIGNVLRKLDGTDGIFAYDGMSNELFVDSSTVIFKRNLKYDYYGRFGSYIDKFQNINSLYKRQAFYDQILLNWKDKYYLLKHNKIYEGNGKDKVILDLSKSINAFILDNHFIIVDNKNNVYEVFDEKNFKIKKINKFPIHLNLVNAFSLNMFQPFQVRGNHFAILIQGGIIYKISYLNGKIILKLISNQAPKEEKFNYFSFDSLTETYFLGTENNGLYILRPQYFQNITNKILSFSDRLSTYAQFEISNGIVQSNDMEVYGGRLTKGVKSFYKHPVREFIYLDQDSTLYYTDDSIRVFDLRKKTLKVSFLSKQEYENLFIKVNGVTYVINVFNVSHIYGNNLVKDFDFPKLNKAIRYFDLIKFDNENILIATNIGLVKYNFISKKVFYLSKESDKISLKSFFKYRNYILVCSKDNGLNYIRNDSLIKIDIGLNEALKSPHCILRDTMDRLWISTNKGVYLVEGKSLIQSINNYSFHPTYYYFGKLNGMKNEEMNSGCTPCGIVLNNGKFSFPSVDGLVQFNPYFIKIRSVSNKVYLDDVLVDDSLNLINKFLNPELAPSISKVEYSFAIGNNFANRDQTIEYLIDNKSNWNVLNKKYPNIIFYNPEYGQHKLLIRWMDLQNGKFITKEFTFFKSFPWYKSVYFYLLVVTLLIFLIYLIVEYKIFLFKKKLKLRTEIAYDLHDSVGISLTKAIKTTEALKEKTDFPESGLIIQFCKDASMNIRDAMWSLDDSTDRFINLVDRVFDLANQSLLQTNFTLNLKNQIQDFNKVLSLPQKRNLLLIIREVIHNIVKHSNGDMVNILFREIDKKIHIIIEDNGFNANDFISENGIGMKSINMRANKMNGVVIINKSTKGFSVTIII